MPTRWPTVRSRTWEPTAETVPTISWPGMKGNLLKPQSLSIRWMSEWQTPQCEILTSTSFAFSSPGSYLYGTNCAPAAWTANP